MHSGRSRTAAQGAAPKVPLPGLRCRTEPARKGLSACNVPLPRCGLDCGYIPRLPDGPAPQRERNTDVMRSTARAFAFVLAVPLMMSVAAAEAPKFAKNATSFTLDNGLQVVVIPDHRAPIVTHMVWYKAGAADEQPGKSGIAHFLEHLMFKGTRRSSRRRVLARWSARSAATRTPSPPTTTPPITRTSPSSISA